MIKIKTKAKAPAAKPSVAVTAIKEAINAQNEADAAIAETFSSGHADEANPLATINDALDRIKEMWKEDSVPTTSIEVGLRTVMKLLKEYEDVVIELEPERISEIVQSYIALTDEETKTIFDKAAKKKTKKPATKRDKEIKELGKELAASGDDSWLDEL